MRDRTEKGLPGWTEQPVKDGAAIPAEGAFPTGEVGMENRRFSFGFRHLMYRVSSCLRVLVVFVPQSRPVRPDGLGISSSPAIGRAAIQVARPIQRAPHGDES